MLELDRVSHWYADLKVFDNFSLKLYPMDSLVLVGPSGSGKSVLLKMLAGLETPTKGRILYQDQDLSTLSKKDRKEYFSRVGMLFQQNALFDSMRVYDNLDFVLGEVRRSWSREERDREIRYYLKAVGLDHALQLFPGELSGGMQKRLGIARALVLQPEIVFYDDPTAGLDPITSRQIIHMILELKNKINATIVTVTHDMMRAYQLAGKIMVCFHQDFILTGGADETRQSSHPKVRQFINGEVEGPVFQL